MIQAFAKVKEPAILLVILLGLQPFVAASGKQLAFPGADGFGAYSQGGRGGDVFIVTNVNDSGPGSLRNGIESAAGPRTIVFAVSGIIDLKSRLVVDKNHITIAGQTAPGDGICFRNYTFVIEADHVIVRYIRSRLGDTENQATDAISVSGGSNIIIDHCSASWSVDETLSCQSGRVENLTIQWCMITESLRNSVHQKGSHGYGGILGSLTQSVHHNLYAHHSSRNPKVTGRRHCKVDFRNNVIYNWGYNSCYDGTASHVNWINNYYKQGPGTSPKVAHRIFQISDEPIEPGGSNRPEDSKLYETTFYIEGNYVVGHPAVTADNWNGGVDFMKGASEEKHRTRIPFAYPAIAEQTAENAYLQVLADGGASLVRDQIDIRIIDEVRNGITHFGNNGLIDSQNDVGGWPNYKSATAPLDTDLDGMPDSWESSNGLNPSEPSDRNDYTLSSKFTNLEVYINSLVPGIQI